MSFYDKGTPFQNLAWKGSNAFGRHRRPFWVTCRPPVLRSRSLRAGWRLFLAGSILSAPGVSAPGLEGLRVHGTSLCPAPAEVRATLLELIPSGQEAVFEQGVEVALSASGRRYRVAVRTPEKRAEKSYADDHGDCEKRARVAAVFVFLTVMPPEVWADALEEEGGEWSENEGSASAASGDSASLDEADSAVDDHAGTDAPSRPSLVRVELGGAFEVTPAQGNSAASSGIGGELRALLGRGSGRGQLLVGYRPPAELVYPELVARFTRVPAGAGLRWGIPLGDWSLGLDVLLYGELQRVASVGLQETRDQSLVRWGARGGLTLGATETGMFPFASLHATFLPGRRELVLLPRGLVGELPRLWFGASLGIAWEP